VDIVGADNAAAQAVSPQPSAQGCGQPTEVFEVR
jgi:hypothetical protein